MDVNPDELYIVFGELVAVQGISMRRLQGQLQEVSEKLALAEARVKELEGARNPDEPE